MATHQTDIRNAPNHRGDEHAHRSMAHREYDEHSPPAHRTEPRDYVPLALSFWTLLGALPLLSRRMRHTAPDEPTALGFVELCAATYYVSRVVTRERAGSWIRNPFVEPYDGVEGAPALADVQQPAGDGLRAAIGELVTCSRCMGLWSAAALVYLRALAPTHARVIVPVLASAGVNNFLQARFAEATARANEAARRNE